MGRSALWIAIKEALAQEIASGHYAPGDRLPTEAQLAERFAVNRHTVRRALAVLADQDIVFARRGAGVFVRHTPTPYPIGQRVRFHQNVSAANRVPEKRVLLLDTRSADTIEAEALNISATAQVHVFESLSLSDGVPLAISCSVFPATRFPNLLPALRSTQSVTEAFRAHGVADYTRARTEVTARSAIATEAALLHLRPGAPLLGTISVNLDETGQPIEFGRAWFAPDRISLTASSTNLPDD